MLGIQNERHENNLINTEKEGKVCYVCAIHKGGRKIKHRQVNTLLTGVAATRGSDINSNLRSSYCEQLSHWEHCTRKAVHSQEVSAAVR